jgi:hypothetical protein
MLNPEAEGPPFVISLWLFIQYIRRESPYVKAVFSSRSLTELRVAWQATQLSFILLLQKLLKYICGPFGVARYFHVSSNSVPR